MVGGTGNDIYYVDSDGDVVTEVTNEGVDTIYAEVSYTLLNNFDNLYLLGTRNLNATGNSLNNELRGNLANNILNGGTCHNGQCDGHRQSTVMNTNFKSTSSGLIRVNSQHAWHKVTNK